MVVLRADAVDVIRGHARDTYPDECCGALIGRDGIVVEAFPLPNTTGEGARKRFLVSPADYRSSEARARNRDAELLGFYHSHPDHPARPSPYDLEHAWPSLIYVIVSVPDGKPAEMTSWRLREDRSAFEEERIHVKESSHAEQGAHSYTP